MKKLTIVLAGLFLLITAMAAYAMPFFNKKDKLPTTPISVPIDISKKGNKAEISLRIESKEEKERLEPEITAFELEFLYDDPRRSKAFRKMMGWIDIDNFYLRTIVEVVLWPVYWLMEGRKYDKKYTREEWSEIMADNNRVTKLVGGSVPSDPGNPNAGEYPKGYVDYSGIPIPNIHLTVISLDDPNQKAVYDEVLTVKKHPNIGGYFYKYLNHINLKPGNYKIIAKVTADAPEFIGTKVILIIGSYRAKV